MSRLIDLTGQRFGRLTAIERDRTTKSRKPAWNCRCDCGNEITVYGVYLRNGSTKSCGCLSIDLLKERSKTHGMSKSRLYGIWAGIKSRCKNPQRKKFPDYGGRGIKVCEEWDNSFEAFRDWAIANGYRDDLTIDRKDNDGDYDPSNCRWITTKQQSNNRRSNINITHRGETHNLTEWSSITGIPMGTIRRRIERGWSPEEALKKERRKRRVSNNPPKP